ncbi:MAG: GTP cyclohydrolase FolE2 [Spirochaetota bacterium]
MSYTNTLPDVTNNSYAENELTLRWVGMENIAVPLTVPIANGDPQSVPAKTKIFVSLDKKKAKGIHMSRIHAMVNQLSQHVLSKETIDRLLAEAVVSQAGISNHASIHLAFDLILKKPALLSEEYGYQSYPVVIQGETLENGGCRYKMEVTVPYSSTCPCSASLARQLYARAVDEVFSGNTIDKESLLAWIQSEKGSVATPHSQRSYAYIKMTIDDNAWPDLSSLIFHLEDVIGTPVQTAVKRQDEQEFARLNATNLMFCEDTARRIKSCLERMSYVSDYWFKVEHQESLHAHNAVVIDQK